MKIPTVVKTPSVEGFSDKKRAYGAGG